MLDPLGTFQKLRFEDIGVFVRIVIFLFLLTIVFLLSLPRPPRGYVRTKKLLHTFSPEPILCWRREWDSALSNNPNVSQDVLWGLFSGARGRDANRLTNTE